MNHIKIFLVFALAALLAGCSKENGFDDRTEKGGVDVSALTVELAEETRAAAVSVDDFTVEFFRNGSSTPEATYRYGDMPGVVELPVGSYTARAFYGTNPSAAWDAPYYEGRTLSAFSVVADQITVVSDPIVCSRANVKVSVAFSDELKAVMGADAKVTVKVGEHGSSLDFTVTDTDRFGYFAYVAESHTLAATFTGEVEGLQTTETKVYDDVRPGNYYKIVFTIHTPVDEEPGDADATLRVDASVEIENVNRSIDQEDQTLVDDMRPKEEGGDEPEKKVPPTLVGRAPISLDKVNEVTPDSKVIIDIKSVAPGGITGFTVDIISDGLTEEELSGIGLTSHLDLVNPGKYLDALRGLHFIPDNETSLGGKTELSFDISDFMGPLAVFGNQTHQFKFVVTDANGSTKKTLTLKMNP